MRQLYTVIVSRPAGRDFDKAMAWRGTHFGRDRAEEFADEFADALELLSRFPEIASYAPQGRGGFSKTIRRFMLNRTGYCFSYRVNHAAQVITIRRIWPQRGRPPRM